MIVIDSGQVQVAAGRLAGQGDGQWPQGRVPANVAWVEHLDVARRAPQVRHRQRDPRGIRPGAAQPGPGHPVAGLVILPGRDPVLLLLGLPDRSGG